MKIYDMHKRGVLLELTFEGADKKPLTVDVKAKAQENNSDDQKH
jgi:hypothetical protein